MRKPSIFSREYERKMRARRKKIMIITVLILLVTIIILSKSLISNINFDSVRDKIQAWVDSEDNTSINEENLIEETIPEEETSEKLEEETKVEEKLIEFKVNETDTLVMEYEEVNGAQKFKDVKENRANLTYSINPAKTAVITIDKNQDMKVFNIDKSEAIIHAANYVAPNGEVFEKNNVIKTYSNYLWNVEVKFVSDTKAAYISNVPYFGYDLDKYIWIVDVKDKSHKTLWNSKGKDVKLNNLADKGLEVLIDGNVKYINQNGELIN
ncbi:MAG: hypothetical protein GX258_04260 [Clostridiales bacterium]|nr:hypothetical protein [Clostridiales bacterium]